jgi:hypothetical protein
LPLETLTTAMKGFGATCVLSTAEEKGGI